MKTFFLCLCTVGTITAAGQNLLSNPGFEINSRCPFSGGQIDTATSWSSAGNSPDYFNLCGTGPAKIPDAYMGYTLPHTGDAVAGFYAYDAKGSLQGTEYLITEIPVLKKGTRYRVSLYLSLGNNSSLAVNTIGALFSTRRLHKGATDLPKSQVSYATRVTDTAGWTRLTETFVADSAYTYMIVGSFLSYTPADTLRLHSLNNLSYYFIDDLALEEVKETSAVTETKPGDLSVSIAPHPFSEQASFTFANPGSYPHTLSIYTLQGVVVQTLHTSGSQLTISRKNLPAGQYIYRLDTDSGTVAHGRLLIE